MATQAEKARAFRALHDGEPFVIPNPWDVGSARMLAALGFEALATTSGGFAFTLGRLNGEVTLGETAAHVAALTAATELPLSVDLENGAGAGGSRAGGRARRGGRRRGRLDRGLGSCRTAAVDAAAAAARQLLAGDLSGLRTTPPLEDWFG